MKFTFNLKTALIFLLTMCLAIVAIHAQVDSTVVGTPLPDGLPNPYTDLPGTVDVIYGIGVIALGYLSQLIPSINKIKPWLRVIAIAVIAGGIIIASGFSTFWPVLISYLVSSEFYDKVLKRILGLKTSSIGGTLKPLGIDANS